MGRPQAINSQRRSLALQAAVRIGLSLGLFVLLLGFASYRIYTVTIQKSAHERAEYLVSYYRTRLLQLDRDWELQARDLKMRIEDTHMLMDLRRDVPSLQAYLTMRDTGKRFQHLLIQDRHGAMLFQFGVNLELDDIPLPSGVDNGWYHFDDSKLYRVFVEPIWMGTRGVGRMAVFYEVDNALLYNMATPGIRLTALHDGIAFASSGGQLRLHDSSPLPDSGYAEVHNISWQPGAEQDGTLLRIDAPVQPLFSKIGLVSAAAAIPVLDALILMFLLGFWMLHHGRRLTALRGAVEEFSAQQKDSPSLQQKLSAADGTIKDEIGEVAMAIGDMIELAQQRDREHQQEEAQRRLWSMVFASTNEAIVITDRHNNIVTVNKVFTQLTGYTEAEVTGKNPRILSAGLQPREFYEAMWTALKEQGSWAGEVHDRRKDGSIYPKWLSISVVRDAEGYISNFIGVFQDITERKMNEERLAYLANNDALTGLPNRHLLLDRLQNAIALSRRTGETICVMFLDLDNFKWVNDSLGHASGDQLLTAVAKRLKDAVRTSDTVARLGGDEFVVFLLHTDSDLEVAQIAAKIIDAVSQPLDLSGHEFHVTTSMGISLYPNDGEDAATLLKHADTAMYVAKSEGKNQYRFFDTDMNRHAMERVELEQDMRHALKNGEFELHYQPKLRLKSNSIVAAEALIRWRHPRLGLLLPGKFIPLAEETSLIVDIGAWVIRTACQQVVAWQAEGLGLQRVAVNLSAVQLESDDFVALVERILQETGARPESIEFELTETAVLRNPDRSVVTLNRLHEIGIHLALDDFGTGYSSLSYLKRLPVDTLKIDRSFIEGLPDEENGSPIVRMICALAKSVRMEVVAEGIETEVQRSYLTDECCDFLQGFLISRPLPPDAFVEFLKKAGTGR